MTLEEKLNTFDIPATRRDLNDIGNVNWLLRNLPINNRGNPKLHEVFLELQVLFNLKLEEGRRLKRNGLTPNE